MEKQVLIKELADYKRKLEAAKKNNLAAGVAQAEKKIKLIEAQLEELDAEPTTGAPKKEPKAKAEQKPKKEKPAPEGTMYGIKFEKGEAEGKYNSVIKMADEKHFMVLYKGDTKKDAELILKDGKWEINCCELKEYPEFTENNLKDAINFVLDFKDCLYSRVDRVSKAKKAKKIQAKYEKLSEQEKTANAVEKAAESVENRVEKIENKEGVITGESLTDIKESVSSIIKDVEKVADPKKRKQFIQSLIKQLQKLL